MSAAAGAKKGAAEARAAMSELVTELDRTRKEFAKSTLQLTHLESTVQHLKDAEMKKDQVIAHLETELARREASYAEELGILQEESRSKEAAFAHRTKFLEMELARLRQEVEVAASFEKENRQLRDAVLENQATIEKLQLMNEELRSRAKEDVRDHAAQLEAEFKKRLAESEKRFRAEAYRALSEEAKIALQGNDHLQTVLQRQNDSIEAVLLKCKTLEQAHSKIAGEQELSAQNLQHHVAEIQRLKKQLSDAKARNVQLEDNLRQRKVERASLELLYIEYENGRKQLAKEKERGRRAMREAERWRNRSIQLTQELTGEQREAAEAKLVALTQHNATMETHAVKARTRADRAERLRQRNAAGAALLRQAGGATPDALDGAADDDAWTNISSDDDAVVEEDVLRGTGGKGPTVNPVDILAMWNSNFADRGGAGGGGSRGESPHRGHSDPELEGGVGDSGAIPDESDLPQAGGSTSIAVSAGHRASGSLRQSVELDSGVTPRQVVARATAIPAVISKSTLVLPDSPINNINTYPQNRHQVPPSPPVDERRKQRDAALSVLAMPKQPNMPAPARHFVVQQTTMMMRQSHALPPSELVVVSHGGVKKRGTMAAAGSGAMVPRFLAP